VRVLLASHRYYPVPGGTERLAQTLAEGLVRRGDEVTVLTQREPGTPPEEVVGGARVVRLALTRIGGARFPRGYLRALRREEADVFHLHGNRIWSADFYFPWARFFRWPQVLTGHGFYQYAVRPRRRDRWYFERYFPWAVGAFDAYAALTERERAQLVRWGVADDRVRLVPNGIDLAEFDSRVETPDGGRSRWNFAAPNVAVYAGGFFENKRVDRLIDAIALTEGRWGLLAIGRDVPGSPYSLRYCAERARAAGIEFRAPGPLPRPEVVAALRDSDVVVLGSEYEGFGLLLLEAMAAARPFVAWNAGASPELARLGGGIAVQSVEAFATALRSLEDKPTARATGSRGRAAAVEYSAERMVDRYRSLYAAVGAGR
jgi:glycosyltransferase involved in cell wall biosynthesis